MAETVAVKTQIDIGESAKSLKDLKAEFKELQSELGKTVVGSKEYHEVLQKIGNTKDDIDDLNDAINATTGGGKLQSFAKLGSSIAGGFASAQGAMALFGSESAELEKTLVKIQAAMALSQGLSELEGIGDALNNAKNAAIGLFKTLIANPFLAIAAAVAAVSVAFVAWSQKMKEQMDPLNTLRGAVDSLTKSNKELNDSYDIQITALQGLKANEEAILELQQKKLQNNIAVARANKLLADAELQRAQEQEKSLTKEKTFLEKTISAVTVLAQLNSVSTEKIKENTKAKEENAKTTETELLKAEAELAAFQNVQTQKNLDKQKELNEKRKQQLAEQAKIEAERIENETLLRQRNQEDDLTSLIEHDNQLLSEEERARLEKQRILDEKLADEIKYGLAVSEAQDKFAKDDLEKQRLRRQAAVQITEQSLALTSAIVEAFAGKDEASQKRAFEIQKKIQLAQATIEMIRGTQSAFASASASPITAVFPAYPFIQAGIAAAFGALNIKKITDTKFEGGGGGGSISFGSGGAGTSGPILNNTPQNTTTQLNQETGSVQKTGGQPVVKTYVVSSDVTAAQEVEKKIVNKNKVE